MPGTSSGLPGIRTEGQGVVPGQWGGAALAGELGGRQAHGDVQTARQATDTPLGRTQHGGGGATTPARPYLLGWKAYFGLAQTPAVWRDLDEWLRHRLRAIHLKHWRRGTTAFAQLRCRGASVDVAAQVAANCGRWWRGSTCLINTVLTVAYFDRMGVPRLS
jgi:hypothetical protein